METYFASSDRSDRQELDRQIRMASENPVIDGIMQAVGGLVAVLNKHRQILTLNHRLLKTLGIEDAAGVLGLRPGEALGCRYANRMEAGCGTSEFCTTCGAAIAIVACLGGDSPVERTCSVPVDKDGLAVDLYFHVHASPIRINGQRFILLFLHDITRQQNRAVLERTFFHDINNIIMGLMNASDLFRVSTPEEAAELSGHISSLSARLSREVELHRHLSTNANFEFTLGFETHTVEEITKEIQQTLTLHPAMRGKSLEIQSELPGLGIETDMALLLRVLSNMLINAFEATAGYDTVRLDIDAKDKRVVFSVWNRAAMASAVAGRIFQRNFSTKAEMGRGLGTYSMKLIGERLLGGRVYFETSSSGGTTFFLDMPVRAPHPGTGL